MADRKEDSCRKGREQEKRAGLYLEQHGMRVVEYNFRSRYGEIDIVGYHKGYLVFVEVKYRSTDRKGRPEQAVTLQKQRKISRTADYYRYIHRYGDDKPFRYDVIALLGEQITWYQNAFFHMGRK